MTASYGSATELASVLPRVLIVSRRTVRKNKFVDFVGEYHLDLIVKYGAVPVILPRVSGVHLMLDSFEPIHGVLLCEGEDVDPALYESDLSSLTVDEIEEIGKLHSSDTFIDRDKDSIEFQLARRCLERNIPFLGICRGSQVLNVACGGSLFQDVERELSREVGITVQHINYQNYDGHRHFVEVKEGTPLHEWFVESLHHQNLQLLVNSYHHQGVRRLAQRFRSMAVAQDGLVEAFYDPGTYNPAEGKFIVGLQFHPERMRHEQDTTWKVDFDTKQESVFDYPGCPRAYQEFVKAVILYQKRLAISEKGEEVCKLDGMMEKHRKQIVHSFSVARRLYDEHIHSRRDKMVHDGSTELEALVGAQEDNNNDLKVGAEFLKSSMVFSPHQEKRLKQMGATVRNSPLFFERIKLLKEREAKAKALLQILPRRELHEILEFHKNMVQITSEILERRNNETIAEAA